MNFVYGVMIFFLVTGFVVTLCNATSGTRAKEDRQVDIIVTMSLFGLFIVLIKFIGGSV